MDSELPHCEICLKSLWSGSRCSEHLEGAMVNKPDDLIERLRKYDWHIHVPGGSERTDLPLRAANQLEAYKAEIEAVKSQLLRDFRASWRIAQASPYWDDQMREGCKATIEYIANSFGLSDAEISTLIKQDGGR
jgi:hypothetical protein